MTLITSKEYDEWIEKLTIEDFPEIIGEFKKPINQELSEDEVGSLLAGFDIDSNDDGLVKSFSDNYLIIQPIYIN